MRSEDEVNDRRGNVKTFKKNVLNLTGEAVRQWYANVN